jgi:hypothetical protein
MSISSRFKKGEIFFSYNPFSKKDKQVFKELMNHVAPLKSEYSHLKWGDSDKIEAGNDIQRSLEDYLNTADIIILLLSAEYLASQQCYEHEMQPTLARHNDGKVRIIPVILRHFDHMNTLLAPYRLLPSNGKPVESWSHRDAALAEITTAIRLVIDELPETPVVHSSVDLRPTFLPTIFYGNAHFFTNRETIIARIFSFFTTYQKQDTAILALNGLPGIGKTQIALAYTHHPRASQIYQKTFWLNASSRAFLSQDVSTYALQISLPEKDEENEKLLFDSFKRWLKDQSDWLLVLDHLEDFDLIDLVIPTQSKGHVLFTTLLQATGRYALPLAIPSMEVDAGTLFLLRRAKILWPEELLENAPSETVSKAKAIAQVLNGFPLALEQAGAYIEENGCSLTLYLSLYQDRQAWALDKRGHVANDYHHSVTGTFDLIFK